MGVYYYFVNEDTGEKNVLPVDDSGLHFVAKLNSCGSVYIKEIMEKVRIMNKWDEDDMIKTCPDNGDECIYYNEGKLYLKNVEFVPYDNEFEQDNFLVLQEQIFTLNKVQQKQLTACLNGSLPDEQFAEFTQLYDKLELKEKSFVHGLLTGLTY